jgi:NDP-sugar pyrophosphorylase family protein
MRQIVIFAGGMATRLYPITKDLPKSLLPIGEKIFLDLQIQNLVQLGIHKFHFCLGQHGKQIENFLAQPRFKQLGVTISYDSSPKRGTAGALVDATDYLEDEFLLTYGDSYLPIDLDNLESAWSSFDARLKLSIKSTLNSRHVPNIEVISNGTFRYGSVAKHATHIDYGLMLVNKSIIQDIERESFTNFTSVIESLSQSQEAICASTQSELYEVGSFEGIRELEEYLGESK